MFVERTAHLVAGDVRRFAGLLHGHAELDDVQKKLKKILVLRVAALHRETKERSAVFQGQRRREGHTRAFAGRQDVERVLGFVQHEALHALAHANAGVAGDAGRLPAAAGSHGNRPAFVVRRLNGGCAGAEVGIELRLGFR